MQIQSPPMEKKPIGRRIRRFREKRAWTQEHLAAAAGVSVRTVQRAEEGTLSAETLSAIAGALDQPVESISKDDDYPSVVPVLFYDNPSSLDWLVEAFGFEVRLRFLGPDGRIAHAEVCVGDGLLMIGSPMTQIGWTTPLELGGKTTQFVYVTVEDIETHLQRARDKGAEIVEDLQTAHGQTRYRARDPEGHFWTFAQPV